MQHTIFEQYAHISWVNQFKDKIPIIKKIELFLADNASNGKNIIPSPHKVYRALEENINHTKVLILGQDPYPNPNYATGLAFSVGQNTSPLPKSLINIYHELENDLGKKALHNGDLKSWVTEGVMLLNTSLTTEAYKSNSHKFVWRIFIASILKSLTERDRPLVSILWGKNAYEYADKLQKYPCITSSHPSPLSAHRGFFGSKPFSKSNKLLIQQGVRPINWLA